MSQEMKENMLTLTKCIKEAQETADKTKECVEGEIKEKLAKFDIDSEKAIGEIQKLGEQQKSHEEVLNTLKAMVAVPNAAASGDKKKIDMEYKRSLNQYLRDGSPMPDELANKTAGSLFHKKCGWLNKGDYEREYKSFVTNVNPRGGYFIQPTISNEIITRQFETSPMRQIARVMSLPTKSIDFPIYDESFPIGGWVGEKQSRPITNTPKIGMLTITAHVLYAQPAITQTMIDDVTFDLEGLIGTEIGDAFARTENTAFVNGDGNQKAKGFLTYDPWTTPSTPTTKGVYERGKLEQINSGTNGDFEFNNLKFLQNSLLQFYQPSAVWVMNRRTWGQVIDKKAGTGVYLLDPQSPKQGDNPILLGKPVIIADDMPEMATDSLSIAYGDFRRGYTILDRIGIRVIRDELTDKPNILIYTTKRTGGAVTNYQSIKILKLAV